MNRWAKGLLLVAGIGAGYLLLLFSELLPRPNADQREALALLRQPVAPVAGTGAFSVLWFIGRDTGDRDLESLMREEVQAMAGDTAGTKPVADQFPAIALLKEEACAGFPASCLADLRSRDDGGEALATGFAAHLSRSELLLQASHYRYPFPASGELRLPEMGRTINLRRFANARRYLVSSPMQGLEAACRELAVWRRIQPTSGNLIHHMIAIAFAQGQAGLVSEMLAEWPGDQALPSTCDEALAPLAPVELDACDMWRGEFGFLVVSSESMRGKPPREDAGAIVGWVAEGLLNRRNLVAHQAVDYAQGCPGFDGVDAASSSWVEWAFDPGGIVARDVNAVSSAGKYRERFQQYLDVVRTLRAQAWLREQADLARAWPQLPSDRRPQWLALDYDAAAGQLILTLASPVRDVPERWRLPVAAASGPPPRGLE